MSNYSIKRKRFRRKRRIQRNKTLKIRGGRKTDIAKQASKVGAQAVAAAAAAPAAAAKAAAALKKIDVAKQAGKVGAQAAAVMQGARANAGTQLRKTTRLGKRFINKVKRSIKGRGLVLIDTLVPTYTEKQVQHLEKKISKKAARTAADGAEAGAKIIKNISTNPKFQRQVKKLAVTSFEAAKDGAEVLVEKAGKLSKPAKKMARAAGGVVLTAAEAGGTGVWSAGKTALFVIPGAADGFNLIATGFKLGDKAVKGLTKAGKAVLAAGELGEAMFHEVADAPKEIERAVNKVKDLVEDVVNLAEEATGTSHKRKSKKGGGHRTRKMRRRRSQHRSRKKRKRHKHHASRRFKRRKKRAHKTRKRRGR